MGGAARPRSRTLAPHLGLSNTLCLSTEAAGLRAMNTPSMGLPAEEAQDTRLGCLEEVALLLALTSG